MSLNAINARRSRMTPNELKVMSYNNVICHNVAFSDLKYALSSETMNSVVCGISERPVFYL